jgi:hypothetical protein
VEAEVPQLPSAPEKRQKKLIVNLEIFIVRGNL